MNPSGDDDDTTKRWEGTAWGRDAHGTPALVDIADCPGECAIGDLCGSQEECQGSDRTWQIVIMSIVGVICLYLFYLACCGGSETLKHKLKVRENR